jgi:hypothetical protein
MLIFNNKDEVIQIINFKSKSSKIHDDTNNIKNIFSLNLWTYYAKYLVNQKWQMWELHFMCYPLHQGILGFY